jgi:hypothetical protein
VAIDLGTGNVVITDSDPMWFSAWQRAAITRWSTARSVSGQPLYVGMG